jgi:hypothetical protein
MRKLALLIPMLMLTACEQPDAQQAADEGRLQVEPVAQQSPVVPEPSSSPAPAPEPSASPSPVVAVNHAPTISVSDQSGVEGSQLVFSVIGNDPDSNPLTYSCQGCPAGASITTTSGIQVKWTPGFSDAGVYPIRLIVDDGLLTAYQDITITIANTNRPPVLNAISSQSISEGATLEITPVASDPDGDSLTITTGSLPANASFSAGKLTFTPDFSQSGSHQITFNVTDGSLSASETVTISVNDMNRAPVLAAIGAKSVSENQALTFSVSASDADGQSVSIVASNLPSGATFSSNQLSWTPTCAQEGTYTVGFEASDGALTDSEDVVITVNHTNCFQPTWSSSATLSGSSGNNTNANTGNGSDSDGGGVVYNYVAEYDCNNYAYTKSFNATTHTLALTNPNGSSDAGSHWFLVYIQDTDGSKNYRFVKVSGYSGSFSVQSVAQGTSYSTAGLCGAGTVYQH